MSAQSIELGPGLRLANDAPIVVMGGINVLESAELAHAAAEKFASSCRARGIGYVFKASWDKANRSSISSFRGPGLAEGLRILADIKSTYGVPIITDFHEPDQAAAVADVADVIQVPAFLARQTDLVVAAAKTGRVINVKKPQFLAPQEMAHIIKKCVDAGNDNVLLCERGSVFGYNNLVVDMLGLDMMRAMAPVVMDVTHALQQPGGLAHGAGGRRQQLGALTRATIALGIAGVFVEAHPDPDSAKCDGPCALPFAALDDFLDLVMAVDNMAKSLPTLKIS